MPRDPLSEIFKDFVTQYRDANVALGRGIAENLKGRAKAQMSGMKKMTDPGYEGRGWKYLTDAEKRAVMMTGVGAATSTHVPTITPSSNIAQFQQAHQRATGQGILADMDDAINNKNPHGYVKLLREMATNPKWKHMKDYVSPSATGIKNASMWKLLSPTDQSFVNSLIKKIPGAGGGKVLGSTGFGRVINPPTKQRDPFTGKEHPARPQQVTRRRAQHEREPEVPSADPGGTGQLILDALTIATYKDEYEDQKRKEEGLPPAKDTIAETLQGIGDRLLFVLSPAAQKEIETNRKATRKSGLRRYEEALERQKTRQYLAQTRKKEKKERKEITGGIERIAGDIVDDLLGTFAMEGLGESFARGLGRMGKSLRQTNFDVRTKAEDEPPQLNRPGFRGVLEATPPQL